MGLFVQCLYALSLHLVSVVFGTAIPTSLNIFGKCFVYLLEEELEEDEQFDSSAVLRQEVCR